LKREKALFKTCKVLDDNSIDYWVCNGTLLGIIRENRILPWDHDIDIAVWYDEVSKNTINELFTAAGFCAEPYFGENDCIDFVIDGIRVDISFYKIDNNVASVKWLLPANGIFQKAVFIVSSVFSSNKFPSCWIEFWPIKKLIRFIIALFSYALNGLLPRSSKEMIARVGFNYIGYKGYSYPVTMLKTITYNFRENVIRVPAMNEEVLKSTYGKDWHIPKKDYIWNEEAENLIDL